VLKVFKYYFVSLFSIYKHVLKVYLLLSLTSIEIKQEMLKVKQPQYKGTYCYVS